MSNVFSFTGTLGRDAERKNISGFTLLEFAVANNIGYGDKQKTLWVRCQVWGKRAEGALGDYLLKGTKVFVSGELDLNEYQGKDGTNKSTLTLNAK
jgi:single-strand DNA-binding protein